MIDFRYHLVSLISVFLALAVGIALGAGPLKEAIGDTLTGQVDKLREEKDALRSELDTASADVAAVEEFVTAAGPTLVADTLTDRNVAVVVLGEVDADTVAEITGDLTDAGATVTAQATLTDAWSSVDQRSFRQALVANMTDYLDPAPADDASADTALADALVQGLTGADPSDPTKSSSAATTLVGLLTSGDDPLLSLSGNVSAPADAVVLLTDQVDMDAPDESADRNVDQDQLDATLGSYTALARVAQERSEGAVVADGRGGDGTLSAAILADEATAEAVTTVNGVQGATGRVSVPLALNATIGGTIGHYGIGDDLTVLPTTTELPAVDRSPQPGGTDDADADAGDEG